MEHITNVLVYSNRCEVLDSHVFTVGDKGFPHIRLKFLYMFGAETLQGKQLELKYILPDKSYQVETISVTGKDEVLFPIHYSVFVNGGWTILKVSIIEGANRITLDDITIKTKRLEAGQEFQHKEVKAFVEAEITKISKKIKGFEEETKTELNTLKTNLSQNLETEKNSGIEALKEAYNTELKKLDADIKTAVTKYLKENTDKLDEIDNKFKGIAGGKVNLTFIQDVGEKMEGEYYIDKTSGKLHRCIKRTSSTVNSVENFKDYSLEAIIKNLESLTETGSNADGAWFKDRRTGLTIQWGKKDIAVTKNGYEEHVVDLPVNFSGINYSVSVSRNYNHHSIATGMWNATSYTHDKIKILTDGYSYNLGKIDTYFWVAIGR